MYHWQNEKYVKGSPFDRNKISINRGVIEKIANFSVKDLLEMNKLFSVNESEKCGAEYFSDCVKKSCMVIREDDTIYEPSEGEKSILSISGLIENLAFDCYLFDEIERGLGNKYISEYIIPKLKYLRDIGKRWLYGVMNIQVADLSKLEPETIIVAKELNPSDTAQINLDNVLAFVTEIGGKTAHSSIMARSLELPAVVGVGTVLNELENNETLIVDAIKGEVIVSPNVETLELYKEKREKFLKEKEELKALKDKEAISKDGIKVDVWGNIGSPNDVKGIISNGGFGIGLYRTEFLFMEKESFPTEDEQFEAYKIVAEELKGYPVTIRTMDIGGDKSLPYMELPKEENPFLGWRAIRVCLDREEILRTQFKALLRASKYGQIKIMLPMIMDIGEIRKAKAIFEECKKELQEKGIEFDKNIMLGIMVETPAVAFRAKYFAKECDFFSIGTNDLTQYTLAVDRGNEKIANLYDTYNPSVLQAIKMLIDGAHEGGIKISMCGEFAGDENAVALLFGMGLDAFSMSGISIPRVKRIIMKLDKRECQNLIERVLSLSTASEIKEEVKK